jgi:hypothetical protein
VVGVATTRSQETKRARQYQHIKASAACLKHSRGDCCANRAEGAGALGRGAHELANIDPRYLVGPPRRLAFRHRPDEGRTYEQLYNEARAMSLHGRSRMNKAQQRAVDGCKGRRG